MAGTQPIKKVTGKMGGKISSISQKRKSFKTTESHLIKSSVVRRTKKILGSGAHVSNQAYNTLSGIIFDMVQTICENATQFTVSSGRKTISANDVLAAFKVVLPGSLKKHCVTEIKEEMAKRKIVKKNKK